MSQEAQVAVDIGLGPFLPVELEGYEASIRSAIDSELHNLGHPLANASTYVLRPFISTAGFKIKVVRQTPLAGSGVLEQVAIMEPATDEEHKQVYLMAYADEAEKTCRTYPLVDSNNPNNKRAARSVMQVLFECAGEHACLN